jgi:hypothetical protein
MLNVSPSKRQASLYASALLLLDLVLKLVGERLNTNCLPAFAYIQLARHCMSACEFGYRYRMEAVKREGK